MCVLGWLTDHRFAHLPLRPATLRLLSSFVLPLAPSPPPLMSPPFWLLGPGSHPVCLRSVAWLSSPGVCQVLGWWATLHKCCLGGTGTPLGLASGSQEFARVTMRREGFIKGCWWSSQQLFPLSPGSLSFWVPSAQGSGMGRGWAEQGQRRWEVGGLISEQWHMFNLS